MACLLRAWEVLPLLWDRMDLWVVDQWEEVLWEVDQWAEDQWEEVQWVPMDR